MDFELTEDQRAFQATARQFARDEMAPKARAWDENETFPVPELRQAAALGFGGIYVKDDVGGSRAVAARRHHHLRGAGAGLHLDRGLHLDPQHGGVDDRRLRRRRRSAGNSCRKLCTMEHFASYCLTEPDSGSDAASLKTKAVRDGDHYVLERHRRRSSPAAACPTSTSAWSRTGGARAEGHLLHRGREGHAGTVASARRRRSSAGNRSRPRW